MPKSKKKPAAPPGETRPRLGPGRQRQRLIDACISALHLYGPSRTTVEKVVDLAKLSPGIVRFYFDSKAAMLVASLQYLSADFEAQVMAPVAQLKATPVAALQRLVELYLDPEIASPRKVSVWYAFWGEASSRQEYYDICGQKDETFAALVHELIGLVIADVGQPHLDGDGISLGLIGALEMLWQDIAFQSEHEIDREGAKRRCMAYLRSVFPTRFGAAHPRPMPATVAGGSLLPRWAYCDPGHWLAERNVLFAAAWQFVCHESGVPAAGDFRTADAGAERVLLVRDVRSGLRAYRNSCPWVPHVLVAAADGQLSGRIECRLHGLSFGLDGVSSDTDADDLIPLPVGTAGGLTFVRGKAAPGGADEPLTGALRGGSATPACEPFGAVTEMAVAADWKVVVESWLLDVPPEWSAGSDSIEWQSTEKTRRRLCAPNQLLDIGAGGMSLLQVISTKPGACLVRRHDFAGSGRRYRSPLAKFTAAAAVPILESIQQGIVEYGYAPGPAVAGSALEWFHQRLHAALPVLRGAPAAGKP